MLKAENVLIMIQAMSRQEIIEMICWFLSREKAKRTCKKQTATDTNRHEQAQTDRDR